MQASGKSKANWDALYELAEAQGGYFRNEQAASRGFSTTLLGHHLRAGRLRRVRRGIYRLVHFPPGEFEDLAVWWLWSKREGLFSHETVLALADLADLLPSKVHMTVPLRWKASRISIPKGLLLHYADVPPEDRSWFDTVPITSVSRALFDCARASFVPDRLSVAYRQAKDRGLLEPRHAEEIMAYLERYGGTNG